jgi:RNA polymerase sigma factor (sigma-70 family)
LTGGALQRRQDGAAAHLYIEYRERIYRFCMARLRSREEAEDAVQNVFMRVHMALDKGVVPEYEAAWLFKIAHNVCLSRAESSSRRTSHETLQAFDDDDAPFAAPEVSRDELAGLSDALEGMPHNLRTAILLREWQGLSYAEIADAMDLSVSAVETLIFRARRHLAYALEHGPDAKPKSVARRLLDLLGLAPLRGLLFGAGPVKLLAAAALVALGTGAGIAVSDAHDRPAPAPAPATPAPRHAVPAAAVHAARARAAAHRAAPARPHNATSAAGASRTHGGRSAGLVASPPRAAAPTWGSQPQPAAPAASAGGTPPAVTSSPAPSAPAQPGLTVPKAQPPAIATTTPAVPAAPPVPSVSVPTVSVPTVSVPTDAAPTVTAPTASVPTVSLPLVG